MQTNSSKFSRRYDREFKENAVALIQSGRSITEVSRDLGVSDWSLRQWLKAIEGAQALNESKRLSSRRRSSARSAGCARRMIICAGSGTF